MLVSRYLTYICILVRHASLGVRVCKEAGIEMVALIFFFPPSYLRVRSRGRLLFPSTPSKYDITFLRYGFKTAFPRRIKIRHSSLQFRSISNSFLPRESKFSFTSAFRFILSFSFRAKRCKKNWCWTEMEIRAYRPGLLPLAPRGWRYKRSNFCLPLELVSDW